ncbi:MAG: hypothetical protein AAB870_03340, partial [Patescibacteria group bacterium]
MLAMANESNFSVNLMAELAITLGKAKFEKKHIGELVKSETICSQILSVLEGKAEIVAKPPAPLEVWKTIDLGTFLNVASVEPSIKEKGFFVGDYARSIMGKPVFTLSTEKRTIKLCRKTLRELDLPKGGTLEEIFVA